MLYSPPASLLRQCWTLPPTSLLRPRWTLREYYHWWGGGTTVSAPGGVKAVCSNRGATHTPLWRRGLNDALTVTHVGCIANWWIFSFRFGRIQPCFVYREFAPPAFFIGRFCRCSSYLQHKRLRQKSMGASHGERRRGGMSTRLRVL